MSVDLEDLYPGPHGSYTFGCGHESENTVTIAMKDEVGGVCRIIRLGSLSEYCSRCFEKSAIMCPVTREIIVVGDLVYWESIKRFHYISPLAFIEGGKVICLHSKLQNNTFILRVDVAITTDGRLNVDRTVSPIIR